MKVKWMGDIIDRLVTQVVSNKIFSSQAICFQCNYESIIGDIDKRICPKCGSFTAIKMWLQ